MLYHNPLEPNRLIFLVATDVQGPEARKWLETPRAIMTGSNGRDRGDQADLVVQTIGGADRRRMQFTHRWKWRRVSGADRLAPEGMALSRKITELRLRLMRRLTRTDFALDLESREGDSEFEHRWFTLADIVIQRSPRQTLIGSLSGAELIEIYQKWIARNELVAHPAYEPKDIDRGRIYRIVIPPSLLMKLKHRHKNFRDVQAGPQWQPADLWAELFRQ